MSFFRLLTLKTCLAQRRASWRCLTEESCSAQSWRLCYARIRQCELWVLNSHFLHPPQSSQSRCMWWLCSTSYPVKVNQHPQRTPLSVACLSQRYGFSMCVSLACLFYVKTWHCGIIMDIWSYSPACTKFGLVCYFIYAAWSLSPFFSLSLFLISPISPFLFLARL